MNRIGLLTIHDTINFGSQLQTYALYKAIASLGKDITLIDYKCEAIAARESVLPLKEARSLKDVFKSMLLHGNLKKRKQNFNAFMQKNMKISEQFDRHSIAKTNALFDTFLVGSDIVWGLNITGKDYSYMLDFAREEKKKVSFSSSIGTKWENEEATNVASYLARFDEIAVRESMAASWIEGLFGKKVNVTCDPTMLWDREFWGGLCNKDKAVKQKYVLVYMSDTGNNCVKKAIAYGKRRNIPVYYINYRAPYLGTVDKRPCSLEEWLTLFHDADTVFSASYHGLLFSLYFQKKVFYFNWINKSRMDSLAMILSIEDRIGTDENISADRPMNYEIINERIEQMRNESWDVLRRMLA